MERRHRYTPRRRAIKSCDRCRRQKLKCDPARPCLLCVHSGSKCESTRNVAQSAETPKRLRSAKRPPNQASLEENIQSPNQAYVEETPSQQRASEHPATNASSVNFARQVFNEAETGRSLTHGVIPGDTGIPGAVSSRSAWCLKELQLPPNELMWAAIDAYFCRTHWLLGLVHEPSLRANANRILASATWERQDMGHVLLVLTVAALGLKATMNDMTWPGHSILSFLDLNSCELMKRFVSEIRLHLMDLMEDSRIESVQICMLLSSLYGYHGSPSLAWTLARMAINAAIYLELYKVTPGEEGTVNAQVRHHAWNTIMILDTYTSIIYGRPLVSTDAGFTKTHEIQDREELRIDPAILNLPAVTGICDTHSAASFYTAQFRLYDLIRGSISRRAQIQYSTASNIESEFDRIEAAARCASESEALLRQWFGELPLMYRLDSWTQNNRWELFAQSLRNLPPKLQESGNVITLQAASLQITYDSALILVHRPLLELRMNTTDCSNSTVSSVKNSLRVAVEAALRISRFPVHLFQNHYSISFVNFHLFTAGVILCLVPPAQPFTPSAQEAKAGVLRIIQACRAIREKDRTAQYIEEILAEILKVTTTRETRIALGSPEHSERDKSASGPGSSAHDSRSYQANQSQNPPYGLSANTQYPVDSYMAQPSNQSTATVLPVQRTEQPYQNLLVDGPVNLNANSNLGSVDPGVLVEPQALQQGDEIFGSFGKSMLNLFFSEQPRGWSMEDISLVPDVDSTGESTLF